MKTKSPSLALASTVIAFAFVIPDASARPPARSLYKMKWFEKKHEEAASVSYGTGSKRTPPPSQSPRLKWFEKKRAEQKGEERTTMTREWGSQRTIDYGEANQPGAKGAYRPSHHGFRKGR